jgi:hypothetical protein
MRRALAAVAFTAVLASSAAVFTIVPNGGVVNAAPGSATFVIPAHDGYGVAECLSSSSSCAKVIADSWCEAQGFKGAERFGFAEPEDLTGSVQTVSYARRERPFSVTCSN